MRNSTVDSQKHQVYENFYHQFSETLSLQEFKSHTNLDVSLMIKIQVTYDLQEILQKLHVILCNGCPFNNTRYIQRPNSNHYY